MPSRFRVTTACFAVCAAAACSNTATGPDQDLLLTTSGPVRFYARELTSVTVSVTNNSPSRTYQILANGCQDPFTVSTPSGSTFPARYDLCTANAPAPRALPPGQSLSFTRDWDGKVGAGSGVDATPLSPGTYVVRGFVTVADGTTVATNAPLTTEVLARSATR